eukprot:13435199-Alexandrium_andersonii.AAC.1
MSASLVGSEMCIRDRSSTLADHCPDCAGTSPEEAVYTGAGGGGGGGGNRWAADLADDDRCLLP